MKTSFSNRFLLLQVQQFKHKMTHQQASDARTFVVLQQHTTTDFVFLAVSLQQQKIQRLDDSCGVWAVVEMKMQYFKCVVL